MDRKRIQQSGAIKYCYGKISAHLGRPGVPRTKVDEKVEENVCGAFPRTIIIEKAEENVRGVLPSLWKFQNFRFTLFFN